MSDADAALPEQLALVVQGGITGGLASIAVAVVYAVVVAPIAPRSVVVSWLVVAIGVGLARAALARVWKRGASTSSQAAWKRACIVSALAAGGTWGFAATILFPSGHPELYFPVAIMLIGMPAGALASYGPWSPAYALYLASSIGPFAVRCLVVREENFLLVGVIAIVFGGFLMRESWRSTDLVRRNIRQRVERERLAASLESALAQADAANQAKSAFLANMSHELRTPLNAVVGLSEIIADEPRGADTQRFARTIRDSALQLHGLISDVLDLSRIEAGRLELRPEPFDLAALLQEVGGMFHPEAERKNLHLGVEVQTGVPHRLVGDALRIRQVLVNLVGNAIKFTDRGGVDIRVNVVRRDATTCTLRFAVADSGPGIAPENKPLLFQRFSQLAASPTKRHGGSGLGLRICADLVALMGGEIGVDSDVREGSTFWFALPLELQRDDTPDAPAKMTVAPVGPSKLPRLAGHVLIVDDNEVNNLFAVSALQSMGLRTTVALDGQQALDTLKRESFDLVLMDCQMPVMDGYEATRRWRAREAALGKRLPIVAATASTLDADRELCIAAGMDDYLCKPFTRAELHAAIAKWLPRGE